MYANLIQVTLLECKMRLNNNIGITHRDQELINNGMALQALLSDGSFGWWVRK